MYYKVIYDGSIVDVLSDDDIVYVRHDGYASVPLRCRKTEDPFGVLSSDQTEIYAITATEGYDTVTLREFDDPDEYESLKAEIAAQRYVEYVEEPEEDETVDVNALDRDISALEALSIIMGVE